MSKTKFRKAVDACKEAFIEQMDIEDWLPEEIGLPENYEMSEEEMMKILQTAVDEMHS